VDSKSTSTRTLEQQCERIPVISNVEKWKVLTHNVKFRASQNLFICVGTVEDNGIWKVDRRIRHTVREVTQMCTNKRVHREF